jgi:hypothetical protein
MTVEKAAASIIVGGAAIGTLFASLLVVGSAPNVFLFGFVGAILVGCGWYYRNYW